MKHSLARIQAWFRTRFRQWLRRNPKSLKLLRRFRCLGTDAESLSCGLAVGLFFGLTPTVGFQTPLLLASCLMLNANFPIAYVSTWISNPFTVAPLYLAFNWLGGLIIGPVALSEQTSSAYPWLAVLLEEGLQMTAGSLMLALPTATLGYLLAKHLGEKAASGPPGRGEV